MIELLSSDTHLKAIYQWQNFCALNFLQTRCFGRTWWALTESQVNRTHLRETWPMGCAFRKRKL
jgi:hypothetical protein